METIELRNVPSQDFRISHFVVELSRGSPEKLTLILTLRLMFVKGAVRSMTLMCRLTLAFQ